MTLQQSSRGENHLARFLNEIDDAVQRPDVAPEQRQELTPPRYGDQHRSGVDACVTGLVDDLCGKIDGLRAMLDQMKQEVIQSGARSKHQMNEHVDLCAEVNEEINRTRSTVARLAERAHHAITTGAI